MLVSIIWRVRCLISTRVGIIKETSCAKTNSGVTGTTVILLVSRDADSCFGMTRAVSHRIESFLIAVELQGGLWTYQRLPRVNSVSINAMKILANDTAIFVPITLPFSYL